MNDILSGIGQHFKVHWNKISLNKLDGLAWWIVLIFMLLYIEFMAFQTYPTELGIGCSSCSADSSNSRSHGAAISETSILIDSYPIRGPLPWKVLSEELKDEYTLGGRVAVLLWYLYVDSPGEGVQISYSKDIDVRWSKANILDKVEAVKRHSDISSYRPNGDAVFRMALTKYSIRDQSVLVIGSQHPWVEAYCIAHGARVTTVDFNVPIVEDPSLVRTVSISELANSREKFDAVFSYSSLEHDGLGRYGDPLNPNGDIERLKRIRNLLKPGGKLFLGVPMGNDTLVWNAHRIYGRIRFPLLIQGWRLIETVGEFNYDKASLRGEDQPLHVLDLQP